ncbi:unnamed protein product [Arabidopsis thaliana]|uniref:(thale cress) hypothetical protein n=1 Tax=Arabidopsis thaliana TaxID=3702 RepID=A0A7G2E1H9_ARATH|nr:unnamed protein product [Arabidopsis thaliana]
MSGDCAVNFPALLVVCLVILTYDISYVIVPGRQYDLLWVFRNLTQILLELICHHRPAQKPPWKQYVEEELRLIGESEDGLYHINKNESEYTLPSFDGDQDISVADDVVSFYNLVDVPDDRRGGGTLFHDEKEFQISGYEWASLRWEMTQLRPGIDSSSVE